MFVSDTHLPQLLPVAAYRDAAWHGREIDGCLRSAWHLVATTAEFPQVGSFKTCDLLGVPIVMRRHADGIAAFVNVCAHRFARLAVDPCGRCETLRCGYHGWEYDEISGVTRRIPDAPSFRPLEKGQLGLVTVGVEVCGGLVFASLDGSAGQVSDRLAACAGDVPRILEHSHCLGTREYHVDVNWKAAVENTLESYHIAEVHPRTFGMWPDERECAHALGTEGSVFSGPGDKRSWVRSLEGHLLRRCGRERSGTYHHVHWHPTFTMAYTDTFVVALSFLPESAVRTRVFVCWMAATGPRNDAIGHAGLRIWAGRQAGFWLRVIAEDVAMLPRIQSGLNSPVLPGVGLISRREERITHFQRWLLDRVGPAAGAGAVTIQSQECLS